MAMSKEKTDFTTKKRISIPNNIPHTLMLPYQRIPSCLMKICQKMQQMSMILKGSLMLWKQKNPHDIGNPLAFHVKLTKRTVGRG